MPNLYVPTFIGPHADRAARNYARYDFANKVLESVESLGDRLRFRISGNPQPVDILDIENVELVQVNEVPFVHDEMYNLLAEIHGIGSNTADMILSYYPTIDSFSEVTIDDLMELPRIGKKRANLILSKIKLLDRQRQ